MKVKKYWIYMILFLMLFPTLFVSRYARPVVDDFDYGVYTHEIIQNGGDVFELLKAAIYTCKEVYMTFQGTYSSCFLMSLQPGIFGEELYGITTWILIGLIFCGFFVFFRSLKKHILKDKEYKSLYWALLSTVVIVMGLPSPAQGLYWYVGAMHYIPWMMLWICNVSLLINIYYEQKASRRWFYAVLSCICSILISGGNQLTAFGNILMLLIVSGIFLYRRKEYIPAGISLIVAIAGFVIMVIAPGNAVRQSVFQRPGVLKTIIMGALYVLKWTMEWVNGVSILAILLFLPLIFRLAKTLKNTILCRNPIIVFLLSAMVFCGMACVPFFAMGGFGEGRTINVLWIYFMIIVLFNIICFFGWLDQRNNLLQTLNSYVISQNMWLKLGIYMVALVVVGICSSGATGEYSTSVKAVREYANGEIPTYAMENDARFKIYNDSEITDVVVDPLSEKPSLLYVNDIGENSNLWPNTSIRFYYHKDTVVVREKEKE